ncbi:cell wall-binding repeat-containing protein [Mesobacillus sp. AQ2]|uniref:cell wall-binding repeat-containing protein n=1 Tax=Mesobacillus sp. AQ2 TaxID=3043332 RepID=UPI0024C15D71|nr:cell wall-binding repeat-containing protein [Mesobacillus sp. AQ2]WHX40252.1 cell wall-binding repeat-containing protein [Mesobacillus sp. AQ2]
MKKYLSIILVSLLLLLIFPSLEGSAEVTAKRMDGKDRFQVAINVSKEGWPAGAPVVVLANYKAFADALAGSPFAYQQNAPILLTAPDTLDSRVLTEIRRLKPQKIILIGGTGSVSTKISSALKANGFSNIERIAGKDRFEVAYNISKKLKSTSTAVVANGLNFPDALAIAPYAAKNGYPILLTKSNELPVKMKEAISQLGIKSTIISGGEASVGKVVAGQLPGAKRIGGKDRFEVSANIVTQLSPSPAKAFLATGMSFADALTGSVLAAKQGAPLLLTHPTMIPNSVYTVIKNQNINDFVILGGTASVPNDTFLKLTGQMPLLPLEGKTIMLDPGHGGKDPGAVKNGYYEKTLNNQFTEKLAAKLKAMGAKVLFTRQPGQDIFLDLADRTSIANKTTANLFISIHHDSNVSTSPRGLSTHYSSYRPAIETKDVYVLSSGVKYPFVREDTERKVFIVKSGSTYKSLSYQGNNVAYDPTPSLQAQDSKVLAQNFAKALVYPGIGITTTYSSTGTKDHNLFVTRWTKMPSVLIELGFISNPTEVKLLASQSVQDKRAQALANSIKSFYSN